MKLKSLVFTFLFLVGSCFAANPTFSSGGFTSGTMTLGSGTLTVVNGQMYFNGNPIDYPGVMSDENNGILLNDISSSIGNWSINPDGSGNMAGSTSWDAYGNLYLNCLTSNWQYANGLEGNGWSINPYSDGQGEASFACGNFTINGDGSFTSSNGWGGFFSSEWWNGGFLSANVYLELGVAGSLGRSGQATAYIDCDDGSAQFANGQFQIDGLGNVTISGGTVLSTDANGNFTVNGVSQGGTLPYLALKSPNGTVWHVTISNSGVLTTSSNVITYSDHTMFWSLSGSATDSTGAYSFSTASGSVVSTGSTYLLNQNAQMTCTAPPLSVVHTEAAWIRLNSVNYYMRLLNGWMQRWPDGNFTLDNCEQYGDAIPATTGVWYFIVVRITGSQATLSVNGTENSFSSGNTNLVGTNTFVIGDPTFQAGTFEIRDVATWSRCISDAEVAAIYSHGPGYTY